MNAKQINIAFPADLYAAIKAAAEARDISPAYIVREAVIEKFAREGVGTFTNVRHGERTDLAARRAEVLAETYGEASRRRRGRPAA